MRVTRLGIRAAIRRLICGSSAALTEERVDAVVRRAVTEELTRSEPWRAALVVLVLAIPPALALVSWLTSTPAVSLQYELDSMSPPVGIFSASSGPNQAQVQMRGTASVLMVWRVGERVLVRVPVPVSECSRWASQLNGECDGATIHLEASTPIRFEWEGEAFVNLDAAVRVFRVDLPSQLRPRPAADVILTASDALSICFPSSTTASWLSVSARELGEVKLLVSDMPVKCEDALVLSIKPSRVVGIQSVVGFQVGHMVIVASTGADTEMAVAAGGGTAAFGPVRKTVGASEVLTVAGTDWVCSVVAIGEGATAVPGEMVEGCEEASAVQAGRPAFQLVSRSVAVALGREGNMIPTLWQRNAALYATLVGLLITVLLATVQPVLYKALRVGQRHLLVFAMSVALISVLLVVTILGVR